jgi:putative membrane protein
MAALSQSLAGLPAFLLYFGLGLLLFVAFAMIYVRITPYRELALIRDGNLAAAISLSGALLGFVLPLASAIAHSVSALDMVAWGAIASIVQIAVYFVVSRLVPDFAVAIAAARVAPAALLAAVAVGIGLLNAAALTY